MAPHQSMSKLAWMITVILVGFLSEFITWAAFGWPFDWREVSTLASTCLIAVFTFPQSKPPDGYLNDRAAHLRHSLRSLGDGEPDLEINSQISMTNSDMSRGSASFSTGCVSTFLSTFSRVPNDTPESKTGSPCRPKTSHTGSTFSASA